MAIQGAAAMTELAAWLARWASAGIDTIPLRPNEKIPAIANWQAVSSATQWEQYTAKNANIGIRTGNGLAVVDADDYWAVSQLRDFMRGLGVQPAQVQSRRGTHFYLPTNDIPADINSRNLKDIRGEIRAGTGAQVVAPCSVVVNKHSQHAYKFISGSPETIWQTRPITWQDLAALVRDPAATTGANLITALPVKIIYRPMPQKAADLLAWARTATKGEGITYGLKTYPTRSEAEAAIIDILALAGWSFDQIQDIFSQAKPGHYVSVSERYRGRYLAGTYQRAITDLADTGLRPGIANAYKAAYLADYPGRAGASDKALTLALMSQGWVWNTYQPKASLRDIQEFAGNIGSLQTVNSAIERLTAQGLITQVKQSTYDITTLIRHTMTRTNADLYGDLTQTEINHAATFRTAKAEGIGHTAGLLYDYLQNAREGLTVYDLMDLSGKSHRAIINNLQTLQAADLAGVLGVRGKALVYGTGESLTKVSQDYKAAQYINGIRNANAYRREAYQQVLKNAGKTIGKQ